MINVLTGKKFCQMAVLGANKLEADKQRVNDMNVFPVPDGDTGTNMSLTVTSAVKEVLNVSSDRAEDNAKALSSGALRGARGNSGVILSQIFRGFYKGLKGAEVIDAPVFAAAIQKGAETAYKAVQKPKEGTILTVARAASEAACENALDTDDIAELMEKIVEKAAAALAATPDMLPVLKEAGVVDAGGQGLLLIMEGFLEALKREDEEIDSMLSLKEETKEAGEKTEAVKYCVELCVMPKDAADLAGDLKELKDYAAAYGEKGKADEKDGYLRLHIHTEDVNAVLANAMKVGKLTFVKVEAITGEHEHKLDIKQEAEKKEPAKEMGFIAVSAGEGLKDIFTGLGVDYVISGGQTMNPSTDDILCAAAKVNAKNIFVLPNNKNIILAADQAAGICKDRRLIVIPTKSIPQGIGAMLGYLAEESVETNEKSIREAADSITSGSVTYAVRDTHMGDHDIKEGDILAIKENEISAVGRDLQETTLKLFDDMITDESCAACIYYGEDISEEKAMQLKEMAEEQFPDVEFDVQKGSQPIYYYFLSVE